MTISALFSAVRSPRMSLPWARSNDHAWWPAASAARMVACPRKPDPPVTAILIGCSCSPWGAAPLPLEGFAVASGLLLEFGAFVHGAVRAAVFDGDAGDEECSAAFAGRPVKRVVAVPPGEVLVE